MEFKKFEQKIKILNSEENDIKVSQNKQIHLSFKKISWIIS